MAGAQNIRRRAKASGLGSALAGALEPGSAIGRTDIIPNTCPACRVRPTAVRHLTARALECRFCRALLSLLDGVLVVAVPADRRVIRARASLRPQTECEAPR